MKNFLVGENIDTLAELVVHAYQCCYRSTAGRTFSVMFFFNVWSLSRLIFLSETAEQKKTRKTPYLRVFQEE